MTEVAEQHYLALLPRKRLAGLAVTRHGYGRPTQLVPLIEAGHPVPDAAGISTTKRVLALADAVDAEDLVLVLLSGGASANWIAPVDGLTLAEKQAVTRALLKSGAAIGEMNTVRKHLSRIKGGRLAGRAFPRRSRDARNLRRARRRPGGHRLGSDGTRSDDTCRCARRRRPLPPRSARTGDARPQRCRERNTEAGRQDLRAIELPHRSAAGRQLAARPQSAPAPPAMKPSCSATACRGKRARSPQSTQSWRAH